MIENIKSTVLAALVVVSIVQSYFLAYNMPNLTAKENIKQDYVKTDPLGPEEKAENLIFPEMLVLHLGADKHTVLYPNKSFYRDILEKLKIREFKGFQRSSANGVDWSEVRKDATGVELRFGRPIPFELLRRVFKIDADFLFSRDSVEKIWIFSRSGQEEVRTFFFSSDGNSVYESLRADLTVQDVAQIVGFGQYGLAYTSTNGELYVPEKPFDEVPQVEAPVTRFTTEQMQRNLFFDPSMTRPVQDRQEDTQLYTDGKRSLQVGQGDGWMSYFEPIAPTDAVDEFVDNFLAAVQFVNEHGGWNGVHRLSRTPSTSTTPEQSGSAADGVLTDEPRNTVRFQQYYDHVPVVGSGAFPYGYMQLTLQQGAIASYERSLLQLDPAREMNKKARELPGGNTLRTLLKQAAGGERIEALYPAYRALVNKDVMTMKPVWTIRLANGEERVVAEGTAPVSQTP